MRWFLRFFPQFLILESRLAAAEVAMDELHHKIIKTEDDSRIWRSRADWAEAERDKATTALANALKQQSNWQALMTGAPHVPFPEVYTPPPAQPATEPVRQATRPITMRDLQRTNALQMRMAAAERAQTARSSGE